MNRLRLLGLLSLCFFGAGLLLLRATNPLYTAYSPEGRTLLSLAVPAACWLIAAAVAGLAGWQSLLPGAPKDTASLVLARGPLAIIWFAFAVRLFLFAIQ
jgi:hypothetical protein